MKMLFIGLILILSTIVLAGCGGNETASAAENAQTSVENGIGGQGDFGQQFESAYLNRDYDGALSAQMQMSIGIMQLEGTANAVSTEQAIKLLPLWQGIHNGSFENATERNAVLKQIESAMTPDQMNAIAAMNLTFEDMGSWAEANGIELPRGGGFGGGNGGPFADMSEEERTKLREELRGLTQEQRQARFEELGIEFGGRQGGQGRGQSGNGQGDQGRRGGGRFGAIMEPMIALLSARAEE